MFVGGWLRVILKGSVVVFLLSQYSFVHLRVSVQLCSSNALLQSYFDFICRPNQRQGAMIEIIGVFMIDGRASNVERQTGNVYSL